MCLTNAGYNDGANCATDDYHARINLKLLLANELPGVAAEPCRELSQASGQVRNENAH
jgi:hypothetical protein